MNPIAVSILSAMLALAGFPLLAQTEYATDGVHTPLEEEIRWLVNRARSDTGTIFHDANGNGVYSQSVPQFSHDLIRGTI